MDSRQETGGVLGLITGGIVLYLSFAEVLQATFGGEMLPLGKPILD